MSNPIGEITDALGSGLFPSYPGRKPVFWEDGRNVNFDSGIVEAGLGQIAMFAREQTSPVTGIQACAVGGTPTLFFGTLTKLWKWSEAGGIEDITGTPYTGAAGDIWSFGCWGNHVLASNGVDQVQYYQAAGNAANLTGVPFTYAKIIHTTDQYMLAFNTSLGGNWAGWSDIDDITDWTAIASNDAGSQFIRNLDSDIIAAEKLGATIMLYTHNEMFEVAYIGRPFIFGFQFRLEGFGPTGKQAVAAVGRRHFGFGRRGIWVTDAVTSDFIMTPAVKNFIYIDPETRYDSNLGHLVLAWHDQLQNQVIFYYPKESGLGENDVGVGFNYKNNSWTIYDYGRTAADDSGVFPFAVTGDKQGNIFQQAVAGAVTSTGNAGIVELDTETGIVMTGLGDGGLGEGGLGGYTDGPG